MRNDPAQKLFKASDLVKVKTSGVVRPQLPSENDFAACVHCNNKPRPPVSPNRPRGCRPPYVI